MKDPIYPLSTWKPEKEGNFNIEDSDDVLGIARQLIDGNHPGILTTVDEHGVPRARWMATTSFENFPEIYTLTAPKSRKLRHIDKNPYVNWMFSSSDLSLILNLTGKADVVVDTTLIKKIWRSIEDKSHAYFLNNFTERPGVTVVRTVVEYIECCIPQSSLRWQVSVKDLAQQEA